MRWQQLPKTQHGVQPLEGTQHHAVTISDGCVSHQPSQSHAQHVAHSHVLSLPSLFDQ
jgi:hypothetical protein